MEINVDVIYIINLNKEKHNLEVLLSNIPSQLDKIFIIDAVDYHFDKSCNFITETEEIITGFEINSNDFFLIRSGARGCFLSHYRVFQHIIKHKFKNALVLEDDIIFHPNFIENINNIMNTIDNNYGLLYLHNPLKNIDWGKAEGNPLETLHSLNNNIFKNKNVDILINKTEESYGTPGYIINNENNFVSELLSFLNNNELQKQIGYMAPIDRFFGLYFNWWMMTDKQFYICESDLVFDTGIVIKKSSTLVSHNSENYNQSDIKNLNVDNYKDIREIYTHFNEFKNLVSTQTNEQIKLLFDKLFINEINYILVENIPSFIFYSKLLVYLFKNIKIHITPSDNITYKIIFTNTFNFPDNILKNSLIITENTEYRNINNQIIIYKPLPQYIYSRFDNHTLFQLLKNKHINLNLYFQNKNIYKNHLLALFSPLNKYISELTDLPVNYIYDLSSCINYKYIIIPDEYIDYIVMVLYMDCIPIINEKLIYNSVFEFINLDKVILFSQPNEIIREDYKIELNNIYYDYISKNTFSETANNYLINLYDKIKIDISSFFDNTSVIHSNKVTFYSSPGINSSKWYSALKNYINNYKNFDKTVIFDFDIGDGGIGDFIKFYFIALVECMNSNVKFYRKINNIIIEKYIKFKYDFFNITEEEIKKHYNVIVKKPFNYYPYMENFLMEWSDYNIPLNELLYFDNSIKYNVINILPSLPRNYISIHLRMGDKFLETDLNFVLDKDDVRYFSQESIYKFIESNNDKNIIFFCDNNEQKLKIKNKYDNVFITDSQIGHTSLYNTTNKQVLDTITEFYILSYSDLIYSPSKALPGKTSSYGSGFSWVASKFNNIEYIIC